MKKIKKFNEDQTNAIKKVWSVDCKHLDSYDAKHQCPFCKKKFKRLPDVNTFRELIMTYDATDTAWAEVFKTDRSSVTKIRNKVNPKINHQFGIENVLKMKINFINTKIRNLFKIFSIYLKIFQEVLKISYLKYQS